MKKPASWAGRRRQRWTFQATNRCLIENEDGFSEMNSSPIWPAMAQYMPWTPITASFPHHPLNCGRGFPSARASMTARATPLSKENSTLRHATPSTSWPCCRGYFTATAPTIKLIRFLPKPAPTMDTGPWWSWATQLHSIWSTGRCRDLSAIAGVRVT